MNETEQKVEETKEVSEGSIEVTQEILDQHPHLAEKFGCVIGDVITRDRLDANTEVAQSAPENQTTEVTDAPAE